jgi:uncharacterized protein
MMRLEGGAVVRWRPYDAEADMAHDHEHHHHDEHEPVDYETAVLEFRAQKDRYFAEDPHSPVPPAERASFIGLPYFPVDASLRLEDLPLEPYVGDEPVNFAMPTSDGRLREAERAGVFAFEVGGVPCRLTAYTFGGPRDDGSVFLPFLDGTSGHETYGAGRYLDLEREDDGTSAIDFNLAYHPTCVYAPEYSCPITPAENRLPVRIEAGERLAEDHATSVD